MTSPGDSDIPVTHATEDADATGSDSAGPDATSSGANSQDAPPRFKPKGPKRWGVEPDWSKLPTTRRRPPIISDEPAWGTSSVDARNLVGPPAPDTSAQAGVAPGGAAQAGAAQGGAPQAHELAPAWQTPGFAPETSLADEAEPVLPFAEDEEDDDDDFVEEDEKEQGTPDGAPGASGAPVASGAAETAETLGTLDSAPTIGMPSPVAPPADPPARHDLPSAPTSSDKAPVTSAQPVTSYDDDPYKDVPFFDEPVFDEPDEYGGPGPASRSGALRGGQTSGRRDVSSQDAQTSSSSPASSAPAASSTPPAPARRLVDPTEDLRPEAEAALRRLVEIGRAHV